MKQQVTTASDQSSDNNKKYRRSRWICTVDGGVMSHTLENISLFLGEPFDIGQAEFEG